jgi:hypothetical protein
MEGRYEENLSALRGLAFNGRSISYRKAIQANVYPNEGMLAECNKPNSPISSLASKALLAGYTFCFRAIVFCAMVAK